MMLVCPHCESEAVIAETDRIGEWLSCLMCGWVKPREQVIVQDQTIFIIERSQLVVSERGGGKYRNPSHAGDPL